MKILFKKSTGDKEHSIEAGNLLLIKVALLVHYGNATAFFCRLSTTKKEITLYCPNDRELNNLVSRSFAGYVDEFWAEISEAILTIKEI